MKKALFVFGTRPEAIKIAPVHGFMKEHSPVLSPSVCLTGQHKSMLKQVMDVFGIAPDFDLDLMTHGQSLADITTAVLSGLGGVLEEVRPDVVLVQGDTTSAFAAGLAAYYHKIPIGHIEAGLRTHDKYSPFPEEINRRLLTSLSDIHFAPTSWARQNLLREDVPEDAIHVTGNPVIDALRFMIGRFGAEDRARLEKTLASLHGIHLDDRRMVLVTGHRRESFGEGFRRICAALRHIASTFPDVLIVYPMHLNPNVRGPVMENLSGFSNIALAGPLDYESFVFLMDRSYLILTDSGGVQEEAPALGKPVLVMRDVTERPEGVEAGVVRLVGTDTEAIVSSVRELLTDARAYASMSKAINPYGDGHAAERIVRVLENSLYAQAKNTESA